MSAIDANTLLTMIVFAVPFLIVAISWIMDYTGAKSNKRKREEADANFGKVVADLSSDSPTTQLSAAFLLRRYFSMKIGKENYLHTATVGVISSILRTLPTGIFQKTLADGLAYADDLSGVDMQRTNLQGIYLGRKGKTLLLNRTDMFKANIAGGLIDGAVAHNVVMYAAVLSGARIKNSDFSNADFRCADLTNVRFQDVTLAGANFENAINVPPDIASALKNGFYPGTEKVTTTPTEPKKTIFFSMPGYMSKEDELTIKAYRDYLRSRNYEVEMYTRDTYPRFGQLSQVKASIERCGGMVAFGTKQTHIKEGTYRPGMTGEKQLADCWLSTPWNELEVGMAAMKGIPILLVKDESIVEGIFDDVISESFVTTLYSKDRINDLDSNRVLNQWLSGL